MSIYHRNECNKEANIIHTNTGSHGKEKYAQLYPVRRIKMKEKDMEPAM